MYQISTFLLTKVVDIKHENESQYTPCGLRSYTVGNFSKLALMSVVLKRVCIPEILRGGRVDDFRPAQNNHNIN